MNLVHHMPGRLRLKIPQLQRRADLAKAATTTIRRLGGVRLVQANSVTGTLLVHYEARGAEQQALLAAIEEIVGGLGSMQAIPAHQRAAAAQPAANPIVDRVIGMAIEKALERSALALLGVLL